MGLVIHFTVGNHFDVTFQPKKRNHCRMAFRLRVAQFASMLVCAALTAEKARAGNPVLDWNEATLGALKKDTVAPLLVARSLAMVHLAMREASAAAGTNSAEVAATSAAYSVATSLLPSHRAEFDELREKEMSAQSDAANNRNAIAIGEAAARRILDERADDGSSMQLSYVPRTEPGQWRRTPPFFRPPELPQWAAKVKTFAIERPDQFRPSGPPALESKAWADAFNEIKTMGGKESKTRTDEQSLVATFWSDFSYTETPPGHWNSIARTIAAERKFSLAESARLFAVLNVALTDAGIACWDAKFRYNFWRPVTAISRAAEDGNAGTEPDAAWLPLLNTPAHPEYPSGHSTFSGAAAVVLAHFFGGDAVTFTVRSDGLPKVERRFTSLRACAEECGASRVYAGIHYRFSCEDGIALGERGAREVLRLNAGR